MYNTIFEETNMQTRQDGEKRNTITLDLLIRKNISSGN